MNTIKFENLEFDSSLFGFRVVKILESSYPSYYQWKELWQIFQEQKIELAYWQIDQNSNQDCKLLNKTATFFNHFLVSKQVTYAIDLKNLPNLSTNSSIEPYLPTNNPSLEMYDLATQIGMLSRFGTDPNLPKKLCNKMYHSWIRNSVNRSVAKEVLVIKDSKSRVIGMITIGIKQDYGIIGLVAVDPKYRGQKIGTKLVIAAQDYFARRNYKKLIVITQKANYPACNLYEKCGFSREKIDNYYHFWPLLREFHSIKI